MKTNETKNEEIKSVEDIRIGVLTAIDQVRSKIAAAEDYPALAYALTHLNKLAPMAKIENVW